MAEIIKLKNKLRKKIEVNQLEVIKEALEIALQYFISENQHEKAAVLMTTLNAWDEFFNKEGDRNG